MWLQEEWVRLFLPSKQNVSRLLFSLILIFYSLIICRCLKKYCDCLTLGKYCNADCKCVGCKNLPPATSAGTGAKQTVATTDDPFTATVEWWIGTQLGHSRFVYWAYRSFGLISLIVHRIDRRIVTVWQPTHQNARVLLHRSRGAFLIYNFTSKLTRHNYWLCGPRTNSNKY